MDKKSILIFGVGALQKSIIERCKLKGLFTIGIDPNENAVCKDIVDAFEIVEGNDYEGTLSVAEKYKISGIITAATDKPLVMMARIAVSLNLPFYSINTAELSSDKLLMKQKFEEADIPCAKGRLIEHSEDLTKISIDYPVIIKPRDNSGSRGVIFCKSAADLDNAVKEAFQFSKKDTVLVEEYINGKEYSIESLHYAGKAYVIQYTEKLTTEFPYNVELGHIQPADLSEEIKQEIKILISKISKILQFDNCASHTELKIINNNIKIIETSPRLGGDFISSTLVPLSTGINMEDILIDISSGSKLEDEFFIHKFSKCSEIVFFEFQEGKIIDIYDIDALKQIDNVISYSFDLRIGDNVNKITNSSNRYGYFICNATNKQNLINVIEKCKSTIHNTIKIEQIK